MSISSKSKSSVQFLEPLRGSQMVAYALPTLVVSFLLNPINIIQGVYAKYFGLSLTTIAAIIVITRIFDAIIDPLIGYLSDRYYERKGDRKLFIVSGCMLMVFCSYFLYIPAGLNASEPYDPVSGQYLLVWLLLFYLAWTLFEIPHLAWGSDLANSPKEKNTVFSLRVMGYSLGTLLFTAVPLLPIFDSQGFTPHTLAYSVLLVAFFVGPIIYINAIVTPGRRGVVYTSNKLKKIDQPVSFFVLLAIIFNNIPFIFFIMVFFFAGTGFGMSAGLLYIFADSYMGMGKHLPLIYFLSAAISILSIPCWQKLATLFGKKLTLGLGVLSAAVGIFSMVLITPGKNDWLSLFSIHALLFSGLAAFNTFSSSILSDIVDYASWKFGQDYAGIYFSLYTFVTKINIGIGSAVSLTIAGAYGFDAAAINHSAEEVFGLHLAVAYIPTFFILISLVFIVLIPLNARHQAIIRRRLDARVGRASSKVPQYS